MSADVLARPARRMARASPLIGAALALIALDARAQWSSDPASNLAIAPQVEFQSEPRLAANGDGSTWIGWFDRRSGTYAVYVQRLDALGVPTLAPGGLLVSAHPTATFTLAGWDVIPDGTGGCVLTFADARSGGDLDVYAYRIDASGAFLWGADGVTLSSNAYLEERPRCARTTDGQFVFSWSRNTNALEPGAIHVQKLDGAGQPQFAGEGIQLSGTGNQKPRIAHVVASDNGGWIVSWLHDQGGFTGSGHLITQKFDAAGNRLWNGGVPLTVYDTTPLSPFYDPILLSDGAGGAIHGWCARIVDVLEEVRIQHVDAAGTELFAHEGLLASLDPSTREQDPGVVYLPASGDTIVVFVRFDTTQHWSLAAQRFSAAGARLWTDNGRDLTQLDGTLKSDVRCVAFGDGVQAYCHWWPTPSVPNSELLGFRLAGSGAPVWNPTPVFASTVLSPRTDLVVAVDDSGVTRLAWEERRNQPFANVFLQNVNCDGTLGGTSACGTTTYCTAAPNSAGPGASIGAAGNTCIGWNGFTLTCTGLPPGTSGLWLYGTNALQVPFGNGFRCVGPRLHRLGPAQSAGASGTVQRFVDLTAPPVSSGAGAITAGSTWRFQFWYPDPGAGGAGFNLSNALAAVFCP